MADQPLAKVITPTHTVGPEYHPQAEKPMATVSSEISYEMVHVLRQTPQLIALLT
jgi:uracil phosphoribosyltransferase